jgi:hypothetical protein
VKVADRLVKLFKETYCDHGRTAPHGFQLTTCPGGSREELLPNIEAALNWIRFNYGSKGLSYSDFPTITQGIIAAALTPTPLTLENADMGLTVQEADDLRAALTQGDTQ